jgi:hypothetical protein
VKLRHRAVESRDIRECVDLVANHPIIGPRYGSTISHLPEVWLSLIDSEASVASVFYADDGPGAPICFFGITAVVQDDFLRDMKRPPHFWIGPELTRRMIRGESPVLSGKELREANSCGGLNLVCWENCALPGYEAHTDLHRYMMSVFIQLHRGYLWKEIIANQPESLGRLEFLISTGGLLWEPLTGAYSSAAKGDCSEIVDKPHIIGVKRELERDRHRDWAGRWVGTLFDYQAPILGLNRSEQRLLACALGGATDECLASILGTSLPAVKKIWVSVYRRVADQIPGLISDLNRTEIPASGRGREKRRSLLSYLREHPEELRPYSRRLLSRAVAT